MAAALTSIEPLRPLLAHRPLGLFSDIDGTLAPIVPRPEDARVTERCRDLLSRLIAEGVKVALITGRSPEMARILADLDGVAYAGNQGLQLWIDGHLEAPAGLQEYEELAERVLAETTSIDVPGVVFENKGSIVAFHYRQAPGASNARRAILAAIRGSTAAKAFQRYEGRKVIELRPPLPIDKGSALADLVGRLEAKSALCLGDDRTDVDMFLAMHRLREGGLPGLAIAVKSEETAPEVLSSADYAVDGVEGVEWLLGEVLKALDARRR